MQHEGGDPACWLNAVCDQCGALIEAARSTAAGWADCPPRDIAASGTADGIRLGGSERRAKCARRVFHSALAASLKEHGGRTAEQMSGRLGWFVLRYTDAELQDVLMSARRFEVVHTDQSPSYDEPVRGNVRLSEDGRKLSAPRGASLHDLSRTGVRATTLMWTTFSGVRESRSRRSSDFSVHQRLRRRCLES